MLSVEIDKGMFTKLNLEEKALTFTKLAIKLGIIDDEKQSIPLGEMEKLRELRGKYSDILDEIQKIRNVYNRKKVLCDKQDKKSDNKEKTFQFENFEDFYDWYTEQKRECAYCGTKEHVLRELFESKKIESKRGEKRGKTLEIERKNSETNEYSAKNCVLACYFCNNHKSDIISEEDHRTYFANKIGEYLRYKHQNGQGTRMDYPEILSIFSNDGDFKVKVQFKGPGASIADRKMPAGEIDKLIDSRTGNFFSKMYFDDHLLTIHNYDIDLVGKIIKIQTK